uniref:VWA domain-containing protein n=1 Tax=uncultured Methanofollis sp. TaxID=262500 RepID=UPI002628635D
TAKALNATGAVVAETTVVQKVDHAGPYTYSNLSYEREVHVGTTTSISLVLKDRYGNPVDSRKDTEKVTFSVGSPDDRAAFVGGDSSVTCDVDGEGKVTAHLQLGSKAGETIVYVEMPGKISPLYLSIDGVGENVPEKILEPEVAPSSKSVPANGKDIFVVTFTAIDRHGNPCVGAGINISTSLPGEKTKTTRTNRDGRVTITYGPKTTTGDVTITATAVNSTATAETTVRFTSTDPVQMVLTASPQVMASWDVPGVRPAQVMAKVMDEMGNPVEGEVVTFTIVHPASYPDTQNEMPRWDTTSEATVTATTNDKGYAVVLFRPGFFSGYGSSPDRANCTVEAQWKTYRAPPLKMEWTNVPYLSVLTNVTPPNPAWNETVRVNITLIGNGYKLQPKPIDVMLVMDTSGSMGWDNGGDNPSYGEKSRLDEAQEAAKDFVNQMALPARDQVGLVKFASDASVVQNLTHDKNAVNSEIDKLPADGATNMRKAFYLGIKELKKNGRPEAVKAVILMSDGEWNYDGTPLAEGTGWKDGYEFSGNELEPANYQYYDGLGGTLQEKGQWWLDRPLWDRPIRNAYDPNKKPTVEEVKEMYPYYRDIEEKDIYWRAECSFCTDGQFTNQNMSIYANNNQVRLYTIGFASDLKDVEPYLTRLSEGANGTYTWAKNEDELKKVYSDIAGQLKTEAGVNTTLSLDFTSVKVKTNNTTPRSIPGHEAFGYDPYTRERMDWITNGTNIYNRNDRDDTGNWTHNNLAFNIGTIKLNQSWQTTFTLKVLPNDNNVGIIDLFGTGSKLTFNNGTEFLTLPHTPLTVKRTQNNTPIGNATLDIRDLRQTGIERNALDLRWNMTYIGNRTAVEVVEYRSDAIPWTRVRTITRGNGTWEETAKMDIRNLPLTTYFIRVSANSDDAGYVEHEISVYLGNPMKDKKFIVLE